MTEHNGIPNDVTNRWTGKRLKFLIAAGLIVAAVVYLVVSATRSTATYFLTVDELYARGAAVYERNVRISGQAVGDSITFNAPDLILRFDVAGESGRVVSVVFHGPRPDQLRDGAEVILEGRFDGNQFSAGNLMLKCPSRYEEEMGISEQEFEAVR